MSVYTDIGILLLVTCSQISFSFLSCLRVVYRPHSERFSSPRPLSTWRTTNHETGATRLYQGHIVWLEWQS
jgi:hypothetical protein